MLQIVCRAHRTPKSQWNWLTSTVLQANNQNHVLTVRSSSIELFESNAQPCKRVRIVVDTFNVRASPWTVNANGSDKANTKQFEQFALSKHNVYIIYHISSFQIIHNGPRIHANDFIRFMHQEHIIANIVMQHDFRSKTHAWSWLLNPHTTDMVLKCLRDIKSKRSKSVTRSYIKPSNREVLFLNLNKNSFEFQSLKAWF